MKMMYKVVSLMNDKLEKTKSFLSEGIEYPNFNDNGLLGKMIEQYGLQSLYSDRIFLVDFARTFPVSLVNKHFSNNGLSLLDKIMLVDDYQSSVAASSTVINSAIREIGGSAAHNHAMVSTEIVDGEEEYLDNNSVRLFSDLPFEFIEQAALFLSSNNNDAKAYFSGRKLAKVEDLPVKYEYNYQYIRFINMASLYSNAISLLFSDEIDFSKTLGVEPSVINKIKGNVVSE